MSSEPAKEADPPQETPQPAPHAEAAASSSTTAPPTQPPATTAAVPEPSKPVSPPEEAPDPDEDDLSDLDDVLDEFAATNLSNKPAPTSSGPGRPAAAASAGAQPAAATAAVPPGAGPAGAGPGGLFADEDEFAKSLQAGMAELLGEFESNPDMQKQFEDLVKELGEGMGPVPGGLGVGGAGDGVPMADFSSMLSGAAVPEGASTSAKLAAGSADVAAATAAPKGPAADAAFQDRIRATMERMSASNTAASDAASKSAANSEEDFLAAMLREMEKDGSMGSDEDFSKMLLGMMEQLTNKEILYEPMKELHDKFPAWMVANKDKTKKEDWDRYVEQQRLVDEIVGKFEEKGYSDDKVEYREYIVERMQQMQAAGSPPPDLVGDMNAAQEALGDMDAGCPQQ